MKKKDDFYKRVKLTKEEKWYEDHAEEFVPIRGPEYDAIVAALERKKKDMVLNIRVNSWDIAQLKQKAQKLGIKYQSFISEILHKVAQI
jgi:predicted DNA binding CopG/RHH family protein